VTSPASNDRESQLREALGRVASGDDAALGEVYRLSAPRLFGLCKHFVPARHDAEEVLQESFLAVWRSAGSYDPARGSALGWLMALTRNRAIDRLRAAGSRPAHLDIAEQELADPAPDAQASLLAAGERRQLAFCLELLPGADHRLIRAAFLEGSTYSELADRANMPLGTVKSRIRRALLKLRDCMQ
jgi:RNA polymerase sigma factor (sigma-70 family)